MTCVSPEGRITPACPGLWNDAQEVMWTRIAAFVHDYSNAKICLQLGHSGAKGSTRRNRRNARQAHGAGRSRMPREMEILRWGKVLTLP